MSAARTAASRADLVLQRFSPATREWFGGAFAAPTEAQLGAWEAVSDGAHALVVAPTGSGKTLAAFLWAIDRLIAHPRDPQAKQGTRVLYISPLKALAVDVERNLRAPLVGVTQTAKRLGAAPPTVTVGVRSGDTTQTDRRTMIKNPPDLLITTPESLFLMLTSAARETLAAVDTIIIDEVHAVASTKRGAHLAVSLDRLDALLEKPAQRIGLSATVRPPEEVARFLAGGAPVTIVAPVSTKKFDLHVVVPVEDMSDLGAAPALEGSAAAATPQQGSIWPHVEESIVDRILAHRSSIVFANSRRLAERLTARLNEIYAERLQLGSGYDDETGDVPTSARTIRAAGTNRSILADPARRPGSGRPDDRYAGSGAPAANDRVASGRPPAQTMAQSGQTEGAAPLLARAHHGSVSKEQRAIIEDDLKTGRLRCVVATSSLELGIDMGAVDLVVQVESPPSVASGLQRVGRAGHQVGEVSRGIIYPKHRADLIHSAVAAQRMTDGLIETLSVPKNPLDILAQQTVAACALESIDVEEWFDTVRRSAPFSSLPRSAYEATLDLLAGRYPSDEFAELRPRIVWDRDAGTLTGRPGAQRLAVTSGGTIPDRGLFGVFMVGEKASRVGELDEEMVYESRVGDVFALGATSWRIQEITHDQVRVTPAFGEPGRLPFWRGDGLGRPAELGRAIGEFTRTVAGSSESRALQIARDAGLDENAATNLVAFITEQREATGHVPGDTTLVVERFRDELGDWRVILHSPYGMQVHSPWALAIGARIRERFGVDGGVVASDDGIVVRLPDTESDPPGAELFVFDADELEILVTTEVGGSALFASRFRESAARALLLPRQNPGKRSPLWQQRQRSAQLLEVARRYPTFPIILETVRECLQDVYDLPSLKSLAGEIESRTIRIVETETPEPSPFARSLLFGYVASFVYEGDSPLAERRAAALSLDPTLLAELLGRAELRELLDPAVIEQTERELQRLAPGRKAYGVEGVADLVRMLGPLTAAEIAERLSDGDADSTTDGESAPEAAEQHLQALLQAKRVLAVNIAGEPRWAAIEDASRLRDALGVPIPFGVPDAFIEPVEDPLGDLVGRYARTHGPFTAAEVGARLGLGSAVVHETLKRLERTRRVIEGEFRPTGNSGIGGQTAAATEWCDSEVLRRLRSRSLAALRHEVEPVDQGAFGRFLPAWQHVGGTLRGIDGVLTVIEQLAGVPAPASAWETLVLPSRVSDYSPAMLDELTASGEIVWAGNGSLPGSDGWVSLHLADTVRVTLPEPIDFTPTDLQSAILEALSGGGAYFFRTLADQVAMTLRANLAATTPANPAAPAQATRAGAAHSAGEPAAALSDAEQIAPRVSRSARLAAANGMPTSTASQLAMGASEQASSSNPTSASTTDSAGDTVGRSSGAADAGTAPAPLVPPTGFFSDDQLVTALWDLVWAGLITNDTLAPLRTLTGSTTAGRSAHSTKRSTPRSSLYRGRAYARPTMATRVGPPTVGGRWSLLPRAEGDATLRAHAMAEFLLDRYGVVTRGSVMNEHLPGGFALAYRVLSKFEETGRCRRGYFIEGLGASQFATGGTVDRLRSFARDILTDEPATPGNALPGDSRGGPVAASGGMLGYDPRENPASAGYGGSTVRVGSSESRAAGTNQVRDAQGPAAASPPRRGGTARDREAKPRATTFAASDPANAYGAALPWPTGSGHRPGRKAGALVVLVDGALVLYVERGGKTVLSFTDDIETLVDAAGSLAATVTSGRVDKLTIEKIDGEFSVGSTVGRILEAAGFNNTPRGLRLRSA
ncbi:DNA glycosylase AlkZ-like family protein [Subtercola sp. PAMC28395]|uniref:DNA glycosylase AlkZ-like family protein n=1 Tax=Subtercola sp. PAMC28395 TaxID=2846775 RepID=UPI00209B8AD4|nr:crosslink repair DNA glycosylase YcaQ family protein [Subtercola sp. PAMC28395]